jgi:glucosamine-phosphate N-acetyltransferase|tara:strand:+ start:143 stop:565 length:423 start_codon:yes stop_codon:yes gene_type:complete
MSKVSFRKIKKSDLNDVFVLLNQLKKIDISHLNLDHSWDKFIQNNSSNSIVGIIDNKIIAYGSIIIENKIRGEVAGHIEDIVVDTEVRGKMIGVKLINELIEIGKKNNCYRITLFCKENLINFYSRSGFKVNSVSMKRYL